MAQNTREEGNGKFQKLIRALTPLALKGVNSEGVVMIDMGQRRRAFSGG